MFLRNNGAFPHGATFIPGPHALWSKLKPTMDLMSRYVSHAEAGRKSNLSLSQFLPLKFLTYLLYNSYVVYRCIATEEVMINSLAAPDFSACLSRANVK